MHACIVREWRYERERERGGGSVAVGVYSPAQSVKSREINRVNCCLLVQGQRGTREWRVRESERVCVCRYTIRRKNERERESQCFCARTLECVSACQCA